MQELSYLLSSKSCGRERKFDEFSLKNKKIVRASE